MGGLVGEYELVGDQHEGATGDHLLCEVLHDGLYLEMEVAQHFI